MGRELSIHHRVNENTIIAITKPTEDLEIGDELYLVFDDERIHMFDIITEENLITKNS